MLAFKPPESPWHAILRLMVGTAYAKGPRPGRVSVVPIYSQLCETCHQNFALADHTTTATAPEDSELKKSPPIRLCPRCFADLMPDRLKEYRERRPRMLVRVATLAG